jgi:hypothetical protein
MKALEHACQCGENNWIITKRSGCGNCPDIEYKYQVEDNCECKRGPAHGDGCWILTCKACGFEDYVPFQAYD